MNKSAKRGEILLKTGLWEAPRFEATQLIRPLDWSLNPFDNRSWVWLYHQLAFTNDLLSYDVETKGVAGREYLLSAFEHWWSLHADREAASDDAWHDHGTARRVENVLSLRDALNTDSENHPDWMESMISAHAEFLADAENYTHGTNHGLDQSIALYRVAAKMVSADWRTEYAQLAACRISDEIGYAFASDGGHKENSVQYHNFGIMQLLKIRKLREETKSLNIPKIKSIALILGKATANFAHLIGPGASLHQIGDTAVQPLRDIIKGSTLPSGYKYYRYSLTGGRKGQPPPETSLVLPESGWISFRNQWKDTNAVHLLAHCSFTSNYHRHDDDGSFSLKAYGEDWVIDSGLYQYKEENPYRKYVRSFKAHSLLAPTGASPHRQHEQFDEKSKIATWNISSARSYVGLNIKMFEGYSVDRSFTFETVSQGAVITIIDTARPVTQRTLTEVAQKIENDQATYTSRFIIPMDKAIEIDPATGVVTLTGKTHHMKIACQFDHAEIISGVKEPTPDGWRSTEFGSLEPCQVLEFRHKTYDVSVKYTMNWHAKDR